MTYPFLKVAIIKYYNFLLYIIILSITLFCAMCVAELHRAGLEPGDTEQVIHHLHRELLEAQELANTGKQRCLELQGS